MLFVAARSRLPERTLARFLVAAIAYIVLITLAVASTSAGCGSLIYASSLNEIPRAPGRGGDRLPATAELPRRLGELGS